MVSRWPGAALALLPAVVLAQPYLRTQAGFQGTTLLCVTWGQRTFTYRVDPAGSARTPSDAELLAVDAAFRSWQAQSDACSDFTFVKGPPVTRPQVGRGSTEGNVVVFRDESCADVVPPADPCLAQGSCGNVYACWDHSALTIGLTTVTYSTRTGVASDADVELNSAARLFTTVPAPPCMEGAETTTCVAYDVQATMTHEIGHVVGFDHVDDPSSLMAPTAVVGETRKRLIDVGTGEGFCSTYPRGDPPVPCDPLQAQQRRLDASTVGCAAAATGAWPWLLVLLAPARRRASRAPVIPD